MINEFISENEWKKIETEIKERVYNDSIFCDVLKILLKDKVNVNSRVYEKEMVTPRFDSWFKANLFIHHILNNHQLDKKGFEYCLLSSLTSAKVKAILNPSSTHPGADILIEETPVSLKTEGAKNAKRDTITISKLMESAWMKNFKILEDFHQSIKTHILKHFFKYEKVLMLRSFRIKKGWFYELVEIPIQILRAVSSIQLSDLTELTKAKGTSAKVRLDGEMVWTLRFDGSDDKITLVGLKKKFCKVHAEWTVERKE